MAMLQAKIRQMRNKATIAFFITVLCLMATVTCFSLYIIASTEASFTWLKASGMHLIALGLGVLGIAATAVGWTKTKAADRQKKEYRRQLHEEVLIPAGYEYCPFCKKRLKP